MTEKFEKTKPRPAPLAIRILTGSLKVILPIVVLGGAAFLYREMMASAPQAKRTPPKFQARLVEIVRAEPFKGRLKIDALGTVIPARDVTLSPQVSGEVIEMSENLVPGGRFRKGEILLKLDPRDYAYAVQQKASEVTRARAALTLEEGNQDVAQREYEVLGQELSEADKILVFRQPQLEAAKGELSAARAMLGDANLDLERTVVKAPFDALVAEERVDLGSRLTTQSTIARLVGTDTYWVELKVPHARLRWVIFPTEATEGSMVTLRHPKAWGDQASRTGHVIRLLPELTDVVRMARVLVAVDDPLALKPEHADLPRVLIGQFITGEISGEEIEGTIRLAPEFLHDGTNIWIMNDKDELEIRAVEILYSTKDIVLTVSGVEPGERIIITNIATATEGMPLRINGTDPTPEASETPTITPGSDS